MAYQRSDRFCVWFGVRRAGTRRGTLKLLSELVGADPKRVRLWSLGEATPSKAHTEALRRLQRLIGATRQCELYEDAAEVKARRLAAECAKRPSAPILALSKGDQVGLF
jgi:hypothetical protein